MLTKILQRCKDQIKPGGYVIIADFSYVDQPCDNWFFQMCTERKVSGVDPKPFELFNFYIDKQPEGPPYEVFNIPSDVMFKAAQKAGFNNIEFQLAKSDPEYKDHPVVKRYLQDLNAPDYVMKLRCDPY